MKILMVGTGYVGIISGACFAEFGYQTTCIDNDKLRLDSILKGINPFYEPGLDKLLNEQINNTKRLTFSFDLSKKVNDSDVIFITVGTPSRRLDGDADLTHVFDVAREIATNIKKYTVIVTKSTVPVGTTKKIKEIINETVPLNLFDVVANPEFLREGSAIDDFMRPDRVVIGTDSKKSELIMKEIYKPLSLLNIPIVSTSIETAEIIKYASNSFLATKISFINEVADLCEVVGGDIQEVSKAMGLDKRIGFKFLNAGAGFGGSCFPKDLKAFSATAKNFGINLSIISTVEESNQKRLLKISQRISKYYDEKVQNKTLTILGLSFKPNTDDIRNSPSIIIAKELLRKGAKLNVYDPKAMKNAKKELNQLFFYENAYQACQNSEGLIIATEWDEFKVLNFEKIKTLLLEPVIFDLRNIYNSIEMKKLGMEYFGIGK